MARQDVFKDEQSHGGKERPRDDTDLTHQQRGKKRQSGRCYTYQSCQAQGPSLQARGLAVVDALLLGRLRLALDLPPPPQLLLQVLLDQGQVAVVLLDLLKHTSTYNIRVKEGVKKASRVDVG